jgi:hypothetical protein
MQEAAATGGYAPLLELMAAPFRVQFHSPAERDGLGIGGEVIHACISREIACCSMRRSPPIADRGGLRKRVTDQRRRLAARRAAGTPCG